MYKIEFHVEEPPKNPPREMLLLGVRPPPIERFQAAEDIKWQVVSTLLQMLNLEEVIHDTRWHMQEMHELLSSKVYPPKMEETNRDDKFDNHTLTEVGETSDDRADKQVQMH